MTTKAQKPLKLESPVVAVSFIFKPDKSTLALVGSELATYLVCSAVASGRRSRCRFDLMSQQLASATGYGLRQINRTIQKLQDTGHIIKIISSIFELGSPIIRGTKVPLAGNKNVTLKRVLFHNRLPYLELPLGLFARMPEMSSVELQATIVLLQMTWATSIRSLSIKAATWAKQANIANTRDLYSVVEKMGWCWNIERIGRTFWIERTDLDRREQRLDRAMEREIAKNTARDQERPYPSKMLSEWLRVLGIQGDGGNSDMRIQCPKCQGIKPSLSINLNMGTYGVFFCHTCSFGKQKVVLHLLDALGIPRKTYMNTLGRISESHQVALQKAPPASH